MENNDNYQLSTWNSLWRYIGIEKHATYGFYWMLGAAKVSDYKDWCLYWLGLNDQKPPIIGESPEDFYVRKIYSTSYDCFNRPICGPPENHIIIGLREEVPIENAKHLVLKEGKVREAINFGSYNYLGFGGRHPIVTKEVADCLKNKGSSCNGFAAERGISEEQKKLEGMLAEFLHKEAAVVVPMGFATNSTLIPILVGKGDVVFSDALNHSSIITGIKSANAEVRVFKHNDMTDFKAKLEDLKIHGMKNGQQPKKVMVVVEGLYSMEGEFCPLKEIIALKKAYGFYLYIDEAHSIGALGSTGRGIVEHLGCNFDDVDILMGTFSKSFAAAGGYIASDKSTIQLLKSNCYSYVYGSPMSPVVAQQIISSLNMMKTEEGQKRIAQLRKSSINFRRRLIEAGCHVLGDTDSPVIPVMLYHAGKVKDVSRGYLKRGIAVVGVGAPACPITACRVRFCISAAHTDEDIEKAFKATIECLTETDCIFKDADCGNIIYRPPKVDLAELEALPKEPRKMTPLSENSDNRKILPEPVSPIGLELSSYDIHGFNKDTERTEQLVNIIMNYGCGSCGPRGFYGGTLEHLKIEDKLMKFFNTNDALVYSYGNNVITSIIPVYGGVGDVIIVDECCNYPIQLGCRLAKKAKIIKFKHNDIEDLKKQVAEAKKTLVFPNKISIVTEGVFQCDYSISPLKEISELRSNNVLLIVDDSLGVGAIGATLKGSMEYAGLTMNDIDILSGSLEFVCDTIGGFVVGKYSVIDKQRLFGAGYIFSASAPTFSCTAACIALDAFEKNGVDMGIKIREQRNKFNQLMQEKAQNIQIIGNDSTPYVLLNCEGKNEEIVKDLREKGYFVVLQQHLDEDWCQNKYIRLCIGKDFTQDKMIEFINILSNY
ncbi:serine palmitoyltransferase putative [Entamoeba histolytica]|uniref:serine C-palmitoyltransferase n=9 Tax=Entamoeba histolytica TaxID=5759 RepID=C4LSR6_ENTH1|nr:serine palmitoyltransferase, putative [Entamoeba histolytica HM-1:IMSS]EAL51597.1 serine palmitoyltransferase, putative [Entamoeba histolytica HM-1:IMSS]EMD49295.1 serine palmitoyl-transferase, putative [Entamoeba histolytica KU27]GAT91480.1 serine palmitoyltransferase putative [Entamoeba histolytica]|eukprot:XP_656982.1 serine palmitoyltransferase, putative [Entamoeba histolytica HM-1:IMSS]